MVYFYGIVFIIHSRKPPDSDIQNKPILIFQEAECTYKQHCKADCKSVENHSWFRHRAFQNNGAELRDKRVERIKVLDKPPQLLIQLTDGIENRSQIHPGRQKCGINILNIPKENRRLGKEKPQSYAKDVYLDHNHRNKKHVPVKIHPADNKYNQHCSK